MAISSGNVISAKRSAPSFAGTAKLYWRYRYLTLLMLPSLAALVIFKYIPIYGLTIAFKEFRIKAGILDSPWVGLDIFKQVFRMPGFSAAFRNTLILGAANLLVSFPAQIALALLLNELNNARYKKLVQTFSYLPHFISWITLSGLFLQLLSPSAGPLAALAKGLGLKPYYFMGEPDTFRLVLVAANLWKGIGWGSIIFLAALAGVDQEMYEAALIDGASRFQRVIFITLPAIAPTITIMLIMRSGSVLNDNFDQVYNMTNAAVSRITNVLGVLTYDLGLKNMKYSQSTAIGLFRNLVSFSLVLATNWFSRRVNDYGIW